MPRPPSASAARAWGSPSPSTSAPCWTALKESKADARLCDIPVIMVSNLNERGLAMPLGAADYLTKPVDKQHLAALLRKHCADPAGASILVIEDDTMTRDVLCRLLEG